jgi:hypothetical protein
VVYIWQKILMQKIQNGVTAIDWDGCTHRHAACLQVILAARVPVRGTPASPALARWLHQFYSQANQPFGCGTC